MAATVTHRSPIDRELDRLAIDHRISIDRAAELADAAPKTIKRMVEAKLFPAPVGYAGCGRLRRRPQFLLSQVLTYVRGEDWRAK